MPPPAEADARQAFAELLTPECVAYVAELCRRFSLDPASGSDAHRIFVVERQERQAQYDRGELPCFSDKAEAVALRRGDWIVPAANDCPRMRVRERGASCVCGWCGLTAPSS